jgi:RimJ/RimL family protein N-acetyltransferase
MTLQSKRLVYRSFDQEDRDLLIAKYTRLLEDPENVALLMDGKPWKREAIEEMMSTEQSKQHGEYYSYFSVYTKESNQFLGCLCVEPVDNDLVKVGKGHTNAAEIGYFIDKSFWGMGYGTEMAAVGVAYIERVICDLANSTSMCVPTEIVATTHPDNLGSKKILQGLLPQAEAELISRYGFPRLVFFKPVSAHMTAYEFSRKIQNKP